MITRNPKARTQLQSYRDLQVWKRSMELLNAIYRLTRGFPREELFGLTAQLRRCAVSIPSNIAEGHGRMNPRMFKQFLLIARGSNCELQTQLEASRTLEFGSPDLMAEAWNLSQQVERMLMALLTSVHAKCG